MKRGITYFLTLFLVSAICLGLLSGCGSTYSAKDLVQDTLDLYYLDKPSGAFLMQMGSSEEEAHEVFEDWLNLEIPFFCEEFEIELDSCEEQIEPQIAALYHEIYKNSRYEVGESKLEGDVYTVSVTIWPMDILQKVYDNYMEDFAAGISEKFDAGEYDSITNEEFETLWAQGVIDLVNEHLDELSYLEPETIPVRVEKDSDGFYRINPEDFQKADELILAY